MQELNRKKTPVQRIAEKVGVSESYVRQVLRGERNGTIHRDGKGRQIIEEAVRILNENK